MSHKVLDLVYVEGEEDQNCFYGTPNECQNFIDEQGGATFMYEIVPLTEQEINLKKQTQK
jgi:hypothetical protein